MQNLRKRTENGIKWSAIDQIFRLFVTIGVSAFLARFISPAEFGLFAMVNVVIGFVAIFKDFGLGSAIIQKTQISDIEINNIFWINNLIAFALGTALFFSAHLVADFYSEPKLLHLTQAMAVLFAVGSLAAVPNTLIRKSIDFKKLFTRNITNLLISSGVAIICAFNGWGVWALIAQALISTVAGTYVSYRMVSWRPRWQMPRWQILKPFFSYSLPLFGENTINYWVRNIDNLLVGKLLGEQTLGYYSKSYNLMLLPVRQISGAVIRVIFPAFSLVKHDKNKVWNNYKKLLNVTAFITFPLMAMMFLLGREIILLIYGSAWEASVPIFKALCFLGAFQSLGTYCGSIFSSQGKTMLQFKIGLILKPVMISGIVIGLYAGGIMGMIYGYTITSAIVFLIESFFVTLILDKKFFQFFDAFKYEVLATILVFVPLYFIKESIGTMDILVNILGIGGTGLAAFALISYIFKLEGYLLIKNKCNGAKKDN